MPLYNSESTVRESIESILAMDYPNFELVISDNASTDSSPDICREYLNDRRVRFYANEKNLGPTANYNIVADLGSHAKYFMWAASDDIWHKTFISKCVEKLEKYPTAVLSSPETVFIDMEGKPIEEMKEILAAKGMDTVGLNIFEKYKELLKRCCWCTIYGLYRNDVLKHFLPLKEYYGADVIFMFNLLLAGDIVKVQEPLFYFRFRKKTLQDYLDYSFPNQNMKIEKPITYMINHIIGNLLESKFLDEEMKIELQEYFINEVYNTTLWNTLLQRENLKEENLKLFFRGLLFRSLNPDEKERETGEEDFYPVQKVRKLLDDIEDLKKLKKYELAIFALQNLPARNRNEETEALLAELEMAVGKTEDVKKN